MRALAQTLIRQSWIAPTAMGLIMVASLFDPAHSAIGQHMSELILGSPVSQIIIRILPLIAGVSIILFGLGVALCGGRWSALISHLVRDRNDFSGYRAHGQPLARNLWSCDPLRPASGVLLA